MHGQLHPMPDSEDEFEHHDAEGRVTVYCLGRAYDLFDAMVATFPPSPDEGEVPWPPTRDPQAAMIAFFRDQARPRPFDA